MNNMKYSVLMSVYYKERPEWLKMALESVLNQTIPPDEIVVVKDGDLTKALDATLDLFVTRHPGLFHVISLNRNSGLGAALREGVLNCKNELIARMDSDDYIVPDRCEKQLDIFINHPECECVGCYEAEFEGTIENVVAIHKVPETNEQIRVFMKRRCALLHPTVMYKKQAVLYAGNYKNIYLYEDYDLFIRMVLCQNNICYNIQEALYYIRINDAFYKRRGGVKYMMTAVRFKWYQMKNKYISKKDFFISAGGQTIVCLMPNKLRRWFYLKYLR